MVLLEMHAIIALLQFQMYRCACDYCFWWHSLQEMPRYPTLKAMGRTVKTRQLLVHTNCALLTSVRSQGFLRRIENAVAHGFWRRREARALVLPHGPLRWFSHHGSPIVPAFPLYFNLLTLQGPPLVASIQYYFTITSCTQSKVVVDLISSYVPEENICIQRCRHEVIICIYSWVPTLKSIPKMEMWWRPITFFSSYVYRYLLNTM